MRRSTDDIGALPSSLIPGSPAQDVPTHRPGFLGQIPYAIRAMRPTQWSKNALVLLALVFARRLTDLKVDARVFLAFAAFCLAASTIYIVNDIADREKDRQHPRKRLRPVASGRLSLPLAVLTACVCAAGAAALTGVLTAQLLLVTPDPFAAWGTSGVLFALTITTYVGLNLAYSTWLKHLVLWDVFVIAAGFVLRALAGAFAAPVPISPWFYICATFAALFLALAKRRAELANVGAAAGSRAILGQYTLQLLDQLIAVVVTCTLITYSLYTFLPADGSGLAGNHQLMITIPFVLFGMFRYLYLVYVRNEGEHPDELLWRDPQILATVVLVVLVVIGVLYGIPFLRSHPITL